MTLIIYFLFKYHTFTLPCAPPWYGNNMQSENTFEFPIEYQIYQVLLPLPHVVSHYIYVDINISM